MGSFEETCMASGHLSSNTTCLDIDWCEGNVCGNGDCVDGLMNYTCNCKPGFANVPTADGLDSCVDIDECATQGGTGRCTTNGVCNDKLLGYTRTCNEGYDNSEDDAGLDSCTPIVCG